ncbi:hypothetical protein [Cuniculiplasma divulgatum]|jgi:hypothetical protein|uniref:Uncharacterized protein n=1 Tax=Cuniculiplasma divulgatum TaxID=1673428 RepID=A0A1N5W4H7_9ARCH|nr:hypothetical protein [Cuniculiplasma divulgatum]SIM80134.1 hypothetical protein CSP5_1658 [Cuniculiplasma divulgatum]
MDSNEKRIVKVISIQPFPRSDTGENQFQITFGRFAPVPTENIEYFKSDNAVPPKTFPIVEFVLFMEKEEIPYRVGENWELTIEEKGSFRLKKM